jgi:hypothetical protein
MYKRSEQCQVSATFYVPEAPFMVVQKSTLIS